jgi:hypothetical protein
MSLSTFLGLVVGFVLGWFVVGPLAARVFGL